MTCKPSLKAHKSHQTHRQIVMWTDFQMSAKDLLTITCGLGSRQSDELQLVPYTPPELQPSDTTFYTCSDIWNKTRFSKQSCMHITSQWQKAGGLTSRQVVCKHIMSKIHMKKHNIADFSVLHYLIWVLQRDLGLPSKLQLMWPRCVSPKSFPDSSLPIWQTTTALKRYQIQSQAKSLLPYLQLMKAVGGVVNSRQHDVGELAHDVLHLRLHSQGLLLTTLLNVGLWPTSNS